MLIEPVRRVLESLGAAYALIGAHAMAARGYPRFTTDIDLLTTDPRVLDRATWVELERIGVSIDSRRGDSDDPLGGVVHLQRADDLDVDVILAKWPWEARVIERADRLHVMGADMPVPRTSDLILLKLAAGGYADLHDASALLSLGDRAAITREIEVAIGDVRPDVRKLWTDLARST